MGHKVVSLAVAIGVGLAPGTGHANGRPPGTSTITFQRGMENHVIAGMTFGLVRSEDGGATWTWLCEDAIGYGGMYDPDYVYTASGAVFATTFDGLKVNRDGCVYDHSVLSPAPPAINFISTIGQGSDGAIYAASIEMTDGKVHKSTDDGASFPTSTTPGTPGDWWQSLEVAPSNPSVVYLTGYRLELGEPKLFLALRSDNGGESFSPLDISDITTMPNSTIEIAGVSKTDANEVYARVMLADNLVGDALWRSTDGGQNWEKILEKEGSIAFVVRKNGQLIAGTQLLGAFVSSDRGTNWTPLANAPQINCLTENAAEEVWACTQNYGILGGESDEFGIMKSSGDLSTWAGVLKYQAIAAPQTCSAGTVQKETCDAQLWCGLCTQLGCEPNRVCPTGDGVPGPTSSVGGSGCCQSGGHAIGTFALVAGVAMLLGYRRRGR